MQPIAKSHLIWKKHSTLNRDEKLFNKQIIVLDTRMIQYDTGRFRNATSESTTELPDSFQNRPTYLKTQRFSFDITPQSINSITLKKIILPTLYIPEEQEIIFYIQESLNKENSCRIVIPFSKILKKKNDADFKEYILNIIRTEITTKCKSKYNITILPNGCLKIVSDRTGGGKVFKLWFESLYTGQFRNTTGESATDGAALLEGKLPSESTESPDSFRNRPTETSELVYPSMGFTQKYYGNKSFHVSELPIIDFFKVEQKCNFEISLVGGKTFNVELDIGRFRNATDESVTDLSAILAGKLSPIYLEQSFINNDGIVSQIDIRVLQQNNIPYLIDIYDYIICELLIS
jgi:hypothetical protein